MTMHVTPSSDVSEIPAMVTDVREAFRSGVTRPLDWRRGQLKKMIALLEENEGDLLEALRIDLGRQQKASSPTLHLSLVRSR